MEFNITFPTCYSFLEAYLQKYSGVANLQYDLLVKLYARYLLENSLGNLEIQRFKPSTLAMASLYMCHYMMNMTQPYSQMNISPRLDVLKNIGNVNSADEDEIYRCVDELQSISRRSDNFIR